MRSLPGPGTARFVAAGEDAAGPWLVVERAPGAPLAACVGTVSADWVVRVGRAAFRALAVLHRAGVTHGDPSPDNVVAPADGASAVLVDLGLGTWPGAPPLPEGPFRGTLGYVAPEVARGEAIHAGSDLFSLAATLLHVASGLAARPASSEAARLLSAGEDPVDAWAARAARDLPAGAARALVACCRFDPHVPPGGRGGRRRRAVTFSGASRVLCSEVRSWPRVRATWSSSEVGSGGSPPRPCSAGAGSTWWSSSGRRPSGAARRPTTAAASSSTRAPTLSTAAGRRRGCSGGSACAGRGGRRRAPGLPCVKVGSTHCPRHPPRS